MKRPIGKLRLHSLFLRRRLSKVADRQFVLPQLSGWGATGGKFYVDRVRAWSESRDLCHLGKMDAEGLMLIRSTVAGLSLLAAASAANAADIAMEPEPFSYTYLSVEGGWIHFNDEEVQSYFIGDDQSGPLEVHELDLSNGIYGRAEIGHIMQSDLINGIAAYVYGWRGDESDSETDFDTALIFVDEDNLFTVQNGCSSNNDPCSVGKAKLERSLLEAGLRFSHSFADPAERSGFSLGIEPFVAFFDEDTTTQIANVIPGEQFDADATRTSDLDATAFGALLALDGRHPLAPHTALITRAAAGAYHMDADVDAKISTGSSVEGHYSDDFAGFRGQLALGVEQAFTESISLGVIGRLDYWSAMPSMSWIDGAKSTDEKFGFNTIDKDNLLTLSVGVGLTIALGGSTP